MTSRYDHTQIGYLTIAMLGGALVLIAALTVLAGFVWIALFAAAIILLCLIIFSTLRVWISGDALEIRLGPGPFGKRFPLRDIRSARTVKNPWYYGWGVRVTPQGWLYNVSGSAAVEIELTNGRKYRIGTDEPGALEAAINREIRL